MPSYYDLDTIMTDAQKVPCTFETTVPKLGYLDGNADKDMKEGTKVSLPLWLAEMLAVSQSSSSTSILTIDYPPALSPHVLNALRADPKSLLLRPLATHFYALGARMLELFDDEPLAEVLSETLKERAKEIGDQAVNGRVGMLGEGQEFLGGMDQEERALFKGAHDGSARVRSWLKGLKKA